MLTHWGTPPGLGSGPLRSAGKTKGKIVNSEPVVLINAFEVPEREDEAFIAGWERARAFLSTQPGYISTCLHRSLSPSAEFRFVNVALWQSARAFQDATSQPQFADMAIPYKFHPTLYAVVREG
ncbi:MAG: antibiotic biosynthesis monooxygenase [Deltaproteobacteria bacterium]|nr:antibiotic biosynthesis monooxygenase [Deltaproteobacteria bacterium]